MASRPVARLGDTGSHGGAISSASSFLFVDGLPVARVGDTYSCPIHGANPIISGVPSTWDASQHIARVGSLTACGAKITSGSPTTTVDVPIQGAGSDTEPGLIEKALRMIFGDPDPIEPGLELSEEEICARVADVKNSPAVKQGLKEMLELSNKNHWEYSAYIVEEPPGSGNYALAQIVTDEDLLSVEPGPKPPHAVGQIHTHPNATLAYPSEYDIEYAQVQKEKCEFYGVIANSGDEAFINDQGENVVCSSKPFVSTS